MRGYDRHSDDALFLSQTDLFSIEFLMPERLSLLKLDLLQVCSDHLDGFQTTRFRFVKPNQVQLLDLHGYKIKMTNMEALKPQDRLLALRLEEVDFGRFPEAFINFIDTQRQLESIGLHYVKADDENRRRLFVAALQLPTLKSCTITAPRLSSIMGPPELFVSAIQFGLQELSINIADHFIENTPEYKAIVNLLLCFNHPSTRIDKNHFIFRLHLAMIPDGSYDVSAHNNDPVTIYLTPNGWNSKENENIPWIAKCLLREVEEKAHVYIDNANDDE